MVPHPGGRRTPDRQIEPEDPLPRDRLPFPGKASHPFHCNRSREAPRARHQLGGTGKGVTGAHQSQLAGQRLDRGDDHHDNDTKGEAHDDAA